MAGTLCAFSFHDHVQEGKTLYERNCSNCHGTDGTRGALGAKNLQRSILADSAVYLQIWNGKRIMPAFRKRLLPEQVADIVLYVKSLRVK